MHLVTIHIELDMGGFVHESGESHIMRSIKDKLSQKYKNKLAITTEPGAPSMHIAFFDLNYNRLQAKIVEIYDLVDGECRIGFQSSQVYSWFEGAFVPEPEEGLQSEPQKPNYKGQNERRHQNERQSYLMEKNSPLDKSHQFEISQNPLRRGMRIPIRK